MNASGNNVASNEETDRDGLSPDQLLTAVKQLLIATRRHQARSDRLYANELTSRIIAEMPEGYDVKAAEIVAKMAEAPEDLQRQLAFRSLEAARVILTARHTTDAILMEAVSKGFEYREIVAARSSLSEPVVNRLLFFEETQIENTLLPRAELPLSDSRVRRLISRVEPGSSLGWLLAKRTDLPPRLSLRLFWKVEGDSRRAILKRFNVDPSIAANVFTKVLATGGDRPATSRLANLAQLVARASTLDQDTPRDSALGNRERILGSLRCEAGPGSAQRVSDEALISIELANRIMEDAGGEAFTVLCAAMDIPERSFRKLLAERPSRKAGLKPFGDEARERLVAIHAGLNASSATAILSYWEIDLQDQRGEESRAKLEMDIADIRSRLAEAYGEDDVAEAGANPEAPAPAPAPDLPEPEPEKPKGLMRLFG